MNEPAALFSIHDALSREEHPELAEAVFVATDIWQALQWDGWEDAPCEIEIGAPPMKLALKVDPNAQPSSVVLGPLDYLDE